jgi:hypothetical protein
MFQVKSRNDFAGILEILQGIFDELLFRVGLELFDYPGCFPVLDEAGGYGPDYGRPKPGAVKTRYADFPVKLPSDGFQEKVVFPGHVSGNGNVLDSVEGNIALLRKIREFPNDAVHRG